MTKKDIKVSAEAREIAKSNLEQAQQTYSAFSQAAERMAETVQSGLPEPAKEINGRLFSYANNNINEIFELAQKIVQADSMEEVMRIQNAYFSSQATKFQKQTAELAWSFQSKRKDKEHL